MGGVTAVHFLGAKMSDRSAGHCGRHSKYRCYLCEIEYPDDYHGDSNMIHVKTLFSPFKGKRTYTYKSDLDLKPGDFAVVKTPNSGYQIVKIVFVGPVEATDFPIKPIIQKIEDASTLS